MIALVSRDFTPLLSLSSPSPHSIFLVFASLVSIYFFSVYNRIFFCTKTEKVILCNFVCKDKSWQSLLYVSHCLYLCTPFGFCSALHRSGLQLDSIMYNHCNVSRLTSRQHFSHAFFFCLFFYMSHLSKGWKVLGMCCYDYDFFFTNSYCPSVSSWILSVSPKGLSPPSTPHRPLRPPIPDICHGRHGHVRVIFFWPV